jgi:hypothetical protein
MRYKSCVSGTVRYYAHAGEPIKIRLVTRGATFSIDVHIGFMGPADYLLTYRRDKIGD